MSNENPFDNLPEIIEKEAVERPLSVIEQETRGQIQVLIKDARANPRDISRCLKEALSLATLDRETAESCFYALNRGGKTIMGPSVRLAELIVYSFGNIRATAQKINDDGRFITCRGTMWDIEKTNMVEIDVERRVTNKEGVRFSDDMIVVTTNACSSIAFRNAVFKLIPSVFVSKIFNQCKLVAVGNAETLSERREEALQTLLKSGAIRERIFAALGVGGIESVNLDILATMRGLITAIRDGDTTIDEAFPPLTNGAESSSTGVGATAKLRDDLQDRRAERKKKQAQTPAEPAEPAEPAKSNPVADTSKMAREVAKNNVLNRATPEQLAEVVVLCKKANSSVEDAVKFFVGEMDGELTHVQAAQLISELKENITGDSQEAADTLELKPQ